MKEPSFQRYQSYWVRGYDPENLTYTLAPLNGKGEEIRVKIDRDGDKSKVADALQAALDRRESGMEPVRLVLRKTDKDEIVAHQVVQSGFGRDQNSRKIFDDEGELKSTWTTDMDKAVYRHAEFLSYNAAMMFNRQMVEDPNFFASVRARAEEILREEIKARAANLSVVAPDGNLNSFLPKTATTALRGVETGSDGAIRQRRYDANSSFDSQSVLEDTVASVSQLGNYAMQRAVVEAFTEAALKAGKDPSGRDISVAEKAQRDLLDQGVLLAGHPLKDSPDFAAETAETARIMGAAALAGVLDTNGAKAANEDFDPIGTGRSADGRTYTRFRIHQEIKKELEADPRFAKLDAAQRSQAYAALGADRARQYRDQAAKTVHKVQAAVAGKNYRPKPPQDSKKLPKPPTIREEAEPLLSGGAKNIDDALKDLGSIPIPGL